MEIHGVAFKMATLSEPRAQRVRQNVPKRCCYVEYYDTMIESSCFQVLANADADLDEALTLFDEMKGSNVMPDETILCNIVSACSRARNMSYNRAIYDFWMLGWTLIC